MHFSIWQSKDDQYYWTLTGDNGEVAAVSETYTGKHSALDTIESIKARASGADLIDHTETRSRIDRRLP